MPPEVFSAEKIGDDLKAVADELSDWAASLQAGFFLGPDASVFPALAAVSRWAIGQSYEPSAVNTFLQVSDYYLVAQAHAGNHIIVSHEVPSSSIRKIKIPDARIGWLHRILRLSRIFAEHAERIETIRAHSRFSPLGQVFGVNPGRNFVRTRTVQGQPALFWRFDSDVGLDLSYCEIPNT